MRSVWGSCAPIATAGLLCDVHVLLAKGPGAFLFVQCVLPLRSRAQCNYYHHRTATAVSVCYSCCCCCRVRSFKHRLWNALAHNSIAGRPFNENTALRWPQSRCRREKQYRRVRKSKHVRPEGLPLHTPLSCQLSPELQNVIK